MSCNNIDKSENEDIARETICKNIDKPENEDIARETICNKISLKSIL